MRPQDSTDVTELLARVGNGDRGAFDRLQELLQSELRQLAARCMSGERQDHTLEPTALVNEAYLKLLGSPPSVSGDAPSDSRAHFFGVAARAMRQILVDHSRERRRQKRGGGWQRLAAGEFTLDVAAAEGDTLDLLALDDALARLAQEHERKTRVVELRYFAGLTNAETAEVLGLDIRTVERDWTFAQTWLYRELSR